MKINPYNKNVTQTNSTSNASRKTTVKAGKANSADTSSAGMDKIDISNFSKLVDNAKEIVANTPEIRTDKVSQIKNLVDSGGYKVDASKVASKMVDEHLSELI